MFTLMHNCPMAMIVFFFSYFCVCLYVSCFSSSYSLPFVSEEKEYKITESDKSFLIPN